MGTSHLFDRLAFHLYQQISTAERPYGSLPPLDASYDVFLSQGWHRQKIQSGLGQLVAARIQIALPFLGWYRVVVEGIGAVIEALDLSATGFLPYQPCLTRALPPDTPVVVLMQRAGRPALIIGAVPYIASSSRSLLPDWITQGSSVGYAFDTHYKNLLSLVGKERLWHAQRDAPLDQLITDVDLLTSLGSGLHIDPFMLFLRIDEMCGLFAYYLDRLLRISGYQLEIRSAQHLELRGDDEGELYAYQGEIVYPWERWGYSRRTSAPQLKEQHALKDGAYRADVEPLYDDQVPYCRKETWGGYLGQGRFAVLSLPDDGPGPMRLADRRRLRGVWQESLALDGSYTMSSASAILFVKRHFMPVPQRVRLPDSLHAEADGSHTQYDWAALESVRLANPDDAAADEPGLAYHVHLLDWAMYQLNWKGLYPFQMHEGDFHVPQAQEFGPVIRPSSSAHYKSGGRFPLPAPETAYVDEHQSAVKYYPTFSCLGMLPTGDFVLRGPFGETIRSQQGDIVISCPGRIVVQSGSDTVLMAGKDVISRAREHCEISSATQQIRIKAERDVQVLAGNSGRGGILLESRSQGIAQHYPDEPGEQVSGSGIVVKAAKGMFSVLARDVYVRTGGEGLEDGRIVLDAGKGYGNIECVCGTFYRHLGVGWRDDFGIPQVARSDQASANNTQLASPLQINGSFHCTSFAVFDGQVTTLSGHFASPVGGPVGKLREVATYRQQLNLQIVVASQLRATEGTEYFAQQIVQQYYADNRIGNSQLMKRMSFGFRSSNQYQTENFVFVAAPWQQMMEREIITGSSRWQEPTVIYADTAITQPWPGRERWTAEDSYWTAAAAGTIVGAGGLVKDRPYDVMSFPEWVKKDAESSYRVL